MNLQSLQGVFAKGLEDSPINMSLMDMIFLFGNSILAGLLLAASTHYVTQKLTSDVSQTDSDTLLGTFNILFLCVGMTGVMILVNNNFIRVFAIVAAFTLFRFRVSLGEKGIRASLLFGVMAGMAMGLNETTLGWILVFVYHLLLMIIFIVHRMFNSDTNTSDKKDLQQDN